LAVGGHNRVDPLFVFVGGRLAADKPGVRGDGVQVRIAQPGFDVLLRRGHVQGPILKKSPDRSNLKFPAAAGSAQGAKIPRGNDRIFLDRINRIYRMGNGPFRHGS
jgi:hypothetical protein